MLSAIARQLAVRRDHCRPGLSCAPTFVVPERLRERATFARFDEFRFCAWLTASSQMFASGVAHDMNAAGLRGVVSVSDGNTDVEGSWSYRNVRIA